MADHLQTALQYRKAGFRVIPVNATKQPGCKWKQYMTEQSEEDIRKIFANDCYGIAVITGIDGMEVIDIDCKYALTPGMEAEYMKLLEEHGGINLTDFTVVETPSKGLHVIYKCDKPGGNTKLASRNTTDEEKQLEPNERVKVLFETRGEGGYICAAPTPGYRVIFGKMSQVPRVTMAERAILLNVAKSFNEVSDTVEITPEERTARKQMPAQTDGKPSWEAYSEQTDAVFLLERHGWKAVAERGDRVYLRRPGKNEGMSGDFNKRLNLFKSWSTSTPFQSEKAYSPYGIYTVLEHAGNWSNSARELARMGYGERPTRQVESQPGIRIEQQKKQIDPTTIAAELAKRKYDYNRKPKNVDFNLKAFVDGQYFDVGGFGMLGLVTGLEKSRKTTFLKALIASALDDGKKRINFSLNLSGKTAIFVDTEQPETFFHSTQTHALNMAGIRGNTPIYEAYSFRDLSVDERNEYVEYLVANTPNLGLLVLDGALDFVKNFNDETQCHAFTLKLMEWTSRSGAMILTVIHKGKGSGFMMGHLGSALARKCDFAFEMTHNNESGFTEVAHKYGRTKPFPKFEFTQDENGYPVLDHNEKIDFDRPSPPTVSMVDYTEPRAASSVMTTAAPRNDDEDIPF